MPGIRLGSLSCCIKKEVEVENKKWAFVEPPALMCQAIAHCNLPEMIITHGDEVVIKGRGPISRVTLDTIAEEKLSDSEFDEILLSPHLHPKMKRLVRFVFENVMAYAEAYIQTELSPALAEGTFSMVDLPSMYVSVAGIRDRKLAPASLWLLLLKAALHHRVSCIMFVYANNALNIGEEVWWAHIVRGEVVYAPGMPSTRHPDDSIGIIRSKNFKSAIEKLTKQGASISYDWEGDAPSLFQGLSE